MLGWMGPPSYCSSISYISEMMMVCLMIRCFMIVNKHVKTSTRIVNPVIDYKHKSMPQWYIYDSPGLLLFYYILIHDYGLDVHDLINNSLSKTNLQPMFFTTKRWGHWKENMVKMSDIQFTFLRLSMIWKFLAEFNFHLKLLS
jgi:hypothetical protein